MPFYRLTCRLCKVVYTAAKPFPPLDECECYCGYRLEEYVKEDHQKWEPVLLNHPETLSPKRREKDRRHAKS